MLGVGNEVVFCGAMRLIVTPNVAERDIRFAPRATARLNYAKAKGVGAVDDSRRVRRRTGGRRRNRPAAFMIACALLDASFG